MLTNDIKRKIDSARDILVGKVPDPKAQVEQITTALIYKFMDDMDKESTSLPKGKPQFFTDGFEKYAWNKLMDPRLGGHERLNLYVDAITRMSQNPRLPQLFRDIFKGAFLPYRDPETLNLFLKEINGFAYDHSENLGNAYEYLLSILGSQGEAGQFRTPRHVIDFIVAVVDPQKDETILDPACGTAGFLISAYKHILETNQDKPLTPDEKKRLMANLAGYDISPDMVKLSLVNMYLHGFPGPKIHEYDTLTSQERWEDRFDVIMANPPFMTPKGGIRPHKRFMVQAKRSEVLFVDYIIEHLNTKGRAGLIVPEGIIFQSGKAYKQLRKLLIDDGLYAVASLPAGVFNPYANVKTSILFFDNDLAKSAKDILFVKITKEGFDLGAQRRPLCTDTDNPAMCPEHSDLPAAIDLLHNYKKSLREGTTFTLPANESLALLASKEQIIKSGAYYLSADRYRETIIYTNQKWPMVELGKICKNIKDSINPREHKGLVNYIGLENISKGTGKLVGNPEVEISTIKSTKLRFRQEDVLYGKLRPYLNKAYHSQIKGICSTDILVLRFSVDIAIPKLYSFLLREQSFNEIVLTGVSGARLPRASWKHLANIKVPLPPLDVQEQIVAELDSYQKIIDGAKQVIKNYKPTIKIDPGWEIVPIGRYFRKTRLGLVKSKGDQKDEFPYPYIKMDNITNNGELDLSVVARVKATDAELKNCTLDDGDFIYNTRNAPNLVGKSTVYHGENGKYLFNNNILRIRFTPELNPDFANYYLNSEAGKLKIKSLVSGTTSVAAIYQKDFTTITIPLPPPEVQQQIISQIEQEQKLVGANKQLIEIFQNKINSKLAEVWGE